MKSRKSEHRSHVYDDVIAHDVRELSVSLKRQASYVLKLSKNFIACMHGASEILLLVLLTILSLRIEF